MGRHLLVGLRWVSPGLLGLMHEMGSVQHDPGLLFSRPTESGLLADSWCMNGSQQTALLHERILARTPLGDRRDPQPSERTTPEIIPARCPPTAQPYEESGRMQSHKCHTSANPQAALLRLMQLQAGGRCMIADCGPHQTTIITVLKSRQFVRVWHAVQCNAPACSRPVDADIRPFSLAMGKCHLVR